MKKKEKKIFGHMFDKMSDDSNSSKGGLYPDKTPGNVMHTTTTTTTTTTPSSLLDSTSLV